jgi:ABC-type antimicrobial peptide transport system permease subunit
MPGHVKNIMHGMKRIVLKYGGLSTLLLVGTSAINYALSGGGNYAKMEVIGYMSIFLSMIFVYFGMRQYRDNVNGGAISFMQGLKVGVLIVLLPSIAFGICEVIYIKYLDPEFVEKYYNFSIQEMKLKLSAEEFERQLKVMEGQKAMFSNVFIQFVIMALTVLIIGVAASAICALILHRKKPVRSI